jgi:hypothetical protein
MGLNKPVNFTTAKLLKEKGFEIFTAFEYTDSGKLVERRKCVQNRLCSAPTIAETCMWLYEKHGIWISVDSIDDSTIFRHCFSNIDFNSPTEAYEDAIEYTLNNLI